MRAFGRVRLAAALSISVAALAEATSSAGAPAKSATASLRDGLVWRYLAHRDLAAARDAIAENTPILFVECDTKRIGHWLHAGFTVPKR